MDYPIDSPEFVMSYAQQQNTFPEYSIFGIIITVLVLINYIVKALWTVPSSPEIGQIMPHIFALKMPALIIFPTFL